MIHSWDFPFCISRKKKCYNLSNRLFCKEIFFKKNAIILLNFLGQRLILYFLIINKKKKTAYFSYKFYKSNMMNPALPPERILLCGLLTEKICKIFVC